MVWKATVACILLATSAPVCAEMDKDTMTMRTGRDVRAVCRDTSSLATFLCGGYIMGAQDRDAVVRWMTPGQEYVCELPAGVTNEQKQQVVLSYLDAHPEKWHQLGVPLILTALREAFCKK